MILTRKTMMLVGGLVICSTSLKAKEKVQVLKLEGDQREIVSKGIAYMKGKELVKDLLKQGFELEDFSSEAFAAGFAEAMKEKDSEIKITEFKVAFDLMKAKLQERELALSKKNKLKSDAWLAQNLKKKGVKVTKSGLQYEVLVNGEGAVTPFNSMSEKGASKKRFFIKYLISNKDGKAIEGSPNDKFVGITETAIKGLAEALGMMPKGSKWKLYLKPELAYGAKRIGQVLPPNDIAVLEVILGDVKSAK